MSKPGSNIYYHPSVIKVDIPKLDSAARARIKKAIETKLGSDPLLYGIPLRGTLRLCFKIRVGDYRVVYQIEKQKVIILIICHRKEVYEQVLPRI